MSSFQRYEVAALRRMKDWLPGDALVFVPEVHIFDEEANVIIMGDCGEGVPTLKALLQSDPPSGEIAELIGRELGSFLGGLHTRGSTEKGLLDVFRGNEDGRKLSAFATYGRLVSTLTTDHLPALSDPPLEVPSSKVDELRRIAAQTTQAMLSTEETVVMGDFWPGNILVRLRRDSEGERQVERIFVIDWELAKPGLAGLDVGQFCAEMLLLQYFNEESKSAASGMTAAFLHGYRTEHGAGLDVARTALVHIGAHLIAWTPRIPWGSNELTREVVTRGIEYVVEGDRADVVYIEESVVGALAQRTIG